MKTTGFTLLELSIVIVIIGLIVAGISAGQSLVRQAKIRGIVTQHNDYKVALNSFLLQYDAYPGDLRNASAYWPTCDATPANCNGNGDGNIDRIGPNAPDTVEAIRGWQQLADAGLIEGTYTGVGEACGGRSQVPGSNSPLSDFPYAPGYASSGWMYGTNTMIYPALTISLGSYVSCWGPFWPILTPGETQAIDLKLDDGVPRSGIVIAKKRNDNTQDETDCYTGGSYAAGGSYTLSNENLGCHIGFVIK